MCLLRAGVLRFWRITAFGADSRFPTRSRSLRARSRSAGRPSIQVDVNLVVLHTTVLDDRGRFAEGLKQENFRVLEDKVEQKLAVFKREDVPVSMGLVIDNSGSMRDKRAAGECRGAHVRARPAIRRMKRLS